MAGCEVSCDGVQGVSDSFCSRLATFPLLESTFILRMLTAARGAETKSFTLSTRDVLDRLVGYPFGKVLLSLPPGSIEGVTRQEASVLRKRMIHAQSRWPDLDKQTSVLFLAIDGLSIGLSEPLYSAGERLSDIESFLAIASTMLRTLAPSEAGEELTFGRLGEVAAILHELFENTNNHARRSIDGSFFSWSTRGVLARYFSKEQVHSIIENLKIDELSPVERYCRNILRKPSAVGSSPIDGHVCGFTEVSIFDSGPGLASRWLTRPVSEMTPTEELSASLECFGARKSTSADTTRGYGLVRVLQAVKRSRAFLSVRSNRLHLFRDFALGETLAMQEKGGGQLSPMPVLFDWEMYPARGVAKVLPDNTSTLVSVLLPIRSK